MIDAIHDDVAAMGKVNTFRSQNLLNGNVFDRAPRDSLFDLQILNSLTGRNRFTSLPIVDGVEYVQQKLIFIFMCDDHIVAVEEVLLGSSCSRFQCGYNLRVIAFSIIECGLILKNDQESPGNRLT